MPQYSIAATKDRLSSLIDKALAGEEVVITRHGKPTVELKVVAKPVGKGASRGEWWERLRVLRESQPVNVESSTDLIRRMRDEGP